VHFLVVKRGALGDVVRTAYFADALRRRHGDALRLSWITAPMSLPLIRFNPNIDDVWTSFEEARGIHFMRVFSLDDESEAIDGLAGLDAERVTGAIRDPKGNLTYTDDAAAWFDMGLLSRFGKARADALKKRNTLGHAEIFAGIFGVEATFPSFHGSPRLEEWAARWMPDGPYYVGVNCFAGGRWQSKELRGPEIPKLIEGILQKGHDRNTKVVLIGAGADFERNKRLAVDFSPDEVLVASTDDSVLRLAAVIGRLDLMISSDSLAMHLAISQDVPTVAFFAPTSAPEIDAFDRVTKVVSTASDYCSYRRDADNSSITAERLLAAFDARVTAPRGAFSTLSSK
jgi:heptosyltransferase-2